MCCPLIGLLWWTERSRFVTKKITAPTPIGVKGGCSPQNYVGKVSKTDASQVCLGNTGLCRLCYVEFTYSCVSQVDTLSVVPNAGNVIETHQHASRTMREPGSKFEPIMRGCRLSFLLL